jgi:hypothetical protein
MRVTQTDDHDYSNEDTARNQPQPKHGILPVPRVLRSAGAVRSRIGPAIRSGLEVIPAPHGLKGGTLPPVSGT